MRFQHLPLLIMISVLMLTACGAPSDDAPKSEHADAEAGHHDDIAWFEGSIDEAFAHAKAENKPLFLYWGAVWCPPCHYLKTKIFTREEFVAQTHGMVPVYLDGDTERAQIYGERFGAKGYPTVILFNPAGQEITRMPSTLPVDRYAEVLELAMSRMRPIKEILDDVLAVGPATADPIDINLLAFYAWGQDHEVQLPANDRLRIFRELYQQTPTPLTVERSRFLSLYLTEAIRHSQSASSAGGDATPSDLGRDELRSAVAELLADPALRAVNLDLVLYWSRESVEFLTEADAERTALIAAWKDAARAVEADDSLPVDDRLSALMPRLWLTQLELEPASAPAGGSEATDESNPKVALPEALRDEVRERIAWASTTVTDQGELQTVMSTMAALLEEAALTDEAETLLSERLEETAAPYYYMSWIAGMKREKGENEEALRWYRKAYDSATGRYTRFRWGSIYLRQRIQLAPEDTETLAGESLAILDELLSFDDAFAGGNYSRLSQLESAFEQWNDDGRHEELLGTLRNRVQSACERYPEGGEDAQRSRCRAFLQPGDTTAG